MKFWSIDSESDSEPGLPHPSGQVPTISAAKLWCPFSQWISCSFATVTRDTYWLVAKSISFHSVWGRVGPLSMAEGGIINSNPFPSRTLMYARTSGLCMAWICASQISEAQKSPGETSVAVVHRNHNRFGSTALPCLKNFSNAESDRFESLELASPMGCFILVIPLRWALSVREKFGSIKENLLEQTESTTFSLKREISRWRVGTPTLLSSVSITRGEGLTDNISLRCSRPELSDSVPLGSAVNGIRLWPLSGSTYLTPPIQISSLAVLPLPVSYADELLSTRFPSEGVELQWVKTFSPFTDREEVAINEANAMKARERSEPNREELRDAHTCILHAMYPDSFRLKSLGDIRSRTYCRRTVCRRTVCRRTFSHMLAL
ncbi:uncharacterized protein G2W53_021049 [Senna tora]|uniref:Uncharacterized protein n=1 Tax=Senna tora TaxID=362788 RepID=A0A834WGU6_9FABA|nr:uncharacterized protein G2W53_021049 [Senna tora]